MGWREKDFELVLRDSLLSLVGTQVIRRFDTSNYPADDLMGIIYDIGLSPHPPDSRKHLAKRWRSGLPFESKDVEHSIEMKVQSAHGGLYTLYNGVQRCWFLLGGENVSEAMAGNFNAMRDD